MKKNLNIFAMIVAFAALQACGSKSEQNNNDYSAVEDSVTLDATEVKEEVILTADERRVKLEKETAMREEERRIALEELAKTTPTFTDAKGNIVYNKAEVEPSFEGGKKAMMNYLQDNIKFPKEAQDNGIEGTVFVDFIVSADGSIREVGVTDAPGEIIDPSFSAEAIRVVSAMPKWIPGRQRGKAVEVKYSLPITFRMM